MSGITKQHLDDSWDHITELANQFMDEPENKELAHMLNEAVKNHRTKSIQYNEERQPEVPD
jgi:predicted GTPase